MNDDFDEFVSQVGTEVPTYRICTECEAICIVNHETYQGPKTACDPENECCPYWVPVCLCNGGTCLYTYD